MRTSGWRPQRTFLLQPSEGSYDRANGASSDGSSEAAARYQQPQAPAPAERPAAGICIHPARTAPEAPPSPFSAPAATTTLPAPPAARQREPRRAAARFGEPWTPTALRSFSYSAGWPGTARATGRFPGHAEHQHVEGRTSRRRGRTTPASSRSGPPSPPGDADRVRRRHRVDLRFRSSPRDEAGQERVARSWVRCGPGGRSQEALVAHHTWTRRQSTAARAGEPPPLPGSMIPTVPAVRTTWRRAGSARPRSG